MKKRLTALIIAIVLCLGSFPACVYAAGEVARLDGTDYGTLEDALAAAGNNENAGLRVIEILADISEPGLSFCVSDYPAWPDGDLVSAYALEPMAWAVSRGIIEGKSGTRLAPKDNATRAELAAILSGFVSE